LDDEESEELKQVSHENPQFRGLLSGNHLLSPEEEHELNDIERKSYSLRCCHERVSNINSNRQPNDQVGNVDASQRHVDRTDIPRLNDVRHVHQRHRISCYTE